MSRPSQPTSEGQEAIDVQDLMEYYSGLVSDKDRQLAAMYGRIKNRDREIERLRDKIEELQE